MTARIDFSFPNGDSYMIDLSEKQTAVVGKILGLKIKETNNGLAISCFSDESLEALVTMKNNPLHLVDPD